MMKTKAELKSKVFLKAIFAFALVLAILLSALPMMCLLPKADANGVGEYESEGVEGDFSYGVLDGFAYITECSQKSGIIKIPDKLDGYVVAGLDIMDYYHSPLGGSNVTGFEVSDSNEYFSVIDGVLFEKEEYGLILVNYPIGKDSKKYTVPNGVYSVEVYILNDKLKSVTLSDSVKNVNLFVGGEKFEELNVGASTESISFSVSLDTDRFSAVNVSEQNERYYSVDGVLFEKITNSESGEVTKRCVLYPSGKTERSFVLPDDVSYIDEDAFKHNNNIKNLTIGANLKPTLGVGYIEPLEWLGELEILSEISVSSENPNYSSVDGVLFNKTKDELIAYPKMKSGKAYSVPDSVSVIGRGAFYGCQNLEKIYIPDSVTHMCERHFDLKGIKCTFSAGSFTFPFINCTKLSEVNVSENNKYYSSSDGVLFNKDKTELLYYPEGNTRETYAVPDTVTAIKNVSISGSSFLIQQIENGFSQVASATRLSPFSNCNLKMILIPSSVEQMDGFYDCENLLDVYYRGSSEQWSAIKKSDSKECALTMATIHYDWDGELPEIEKDGPLTVIVNVITAPFKALIELFKILIGRF